MVNGVNKNGIMSSSDIMMQVVNYAQSGEANKIHNVWKNVVSNIHSYKDENIDSDKRIPIGQRLASNTRVVDLKNGVLLVETDHPGWIQYLNMNKNFILKGLKMQIPELQIKTLAFRLSGSDCHLSERYEESLQRSKERVEKMLDKQEKEIEKVYQGKTLENNTEECKLPPELMAKFESIKNDMLTKDKNK